MGRCSAISISESEGASAGRRSHRSLLRLAQALLNRWARSRSNANPKMVQCNVGPGSSIYYSGMDGAVPVYRGCSTRG